MSRHLQREKVMTIIYQQAIRGGSYFDYLEDNGAEDYMLDLLKDIHFNKNSYIDKLNQKLNKWKFERLGNIEQAILLIAVSEYLNFEIPKAVTINEAITLAKKYADEESYKLINATLDKL
ncbi:MAG: transcription antitermination factor NusB [Erysipelotrichaceae bacterium]